MKKFLPLLALSFCFFSAGYSQPGQLDLTYGFGGIAETKFGESKMDISAVNKVLLLPDGSMYVLYTHPNLLAKRHADGSLDVTFGRRGFSAINIIDIADAALQANGKVLITGSKRYAEEYVTGVGLSRYNTDGALDAEFSFEPPNLYNEERPTSVIAGSDGKIVVATSYSGQDAPTPIFVLYQFNADGTRSFKVSDPEFSEGHSLAIQSDGKIVIATEIDNEGLNSFFIARYKTNGKRDSSFSQDGKQAVDFTPGSHGVAIQSDGKIVVAGSVSTNSQNSLAVARYNTDGTADVNFGSHGEQTVKFEAGCSGASAAIQNDGKIVVAGQAQTTNGDNADFFITRFDTVGILDNSFSGDGKQTTDFGSVSDGATVVDIQANGKIVAGGSGSNLARYNTDGTLDNTFSQDGKQALENSISFYDGNAESVALQNDGKAVVVGYGVKNNTTITFLSRLNTDGTQDTTFGFNGQQQIEFGHSIAVQKDGKILVAGSMKTGRGLDFAVARYNSNGTPDITFSKDGKLTTDFEGDDDQATFVAVQNDGKIVVGGSTRKNAFYFAAVARYNTDGTPDNTFLRNGKLTTQFQSLPDPAKFMALQNDGKIVVVPTGEYVFAVARYNANGTLDTTFASDGIQRTDFDGNDNYPQAVAIQSDGKIVVAGTSDISNYSLSVNISDPDPYLIILARYNVDGQLDTTFSNDGMQRISIATSQESTAALAIQNDEKIVVAGKLGFGSFAAQDFLLARLNTNGSLDETFADGGKQVTDISGGNDIINDAAIFGNKLYVTGEGSNLGGVVARYLLYDKADTPPTVTFTTPTNNTTRLAPAAHIKLSAAASDADGSITKVEFYNGTHLLHTETVIPYGFVWRNVPMGNYTLTAKAYDNDGLVTTSAPVHISVVPNKPPVVSIINPKNNETFAASANIQIEADAKDLDGRMARVEFYNGSTLLNIQYQLPYRFVWKDVPAGTYTITAVARDNWGARTTSAPVTITVISNTTIVSSKPGSANKIGASGAVSLTLAPNPANGIINMYTLGLQQDKPATIRVTSASGVVIKTMHLNSSAKTIQLDVSSLVKGVYTIQLLTGDNVLYKQFVKL